MLLLSLLYIYASFLFILGHMLCPSRLESKEKRKKQQLFLKFWGMHNYALQQVLVFTMDPNISVNYLEDESTLFWSLSNQSFTSTGSFGMREKEGWFLDALNRKERASPSAHLMRITKSGGWVRPLPMYRRFQWMSLITGASDRIASFGKWLFIPATWGWPYCYSLLTIDLHQLYIYIYFLGLSFLW